MSKIRRLLIWVTLALFAFLVLFTLYSLFFPLNLCLLAKSNPESTAFIEQRKDDWEDRGSKRKINRKWVPLSRISPNLRRAVIVAEDPNFYHHKGLDFHAIRLAFKRNIQERDMGIGASTITQQLVKNLYLSSSRNPLRKYREAILAVRIERCLKKDRILELYLNVIEWGESTYGAEAAARRYFGKSASQLGTGEAALLAAMIPNPRIYTLKNSRTYKRQRRILRGM